MRTDRDNDRSSDFSAGFLFFVRLGEPKPTEKWSTYIKMSEGSFSDFKKRFVLDGHGRFQDLTFRLVWSIKSLIRRISRISRVTKNPFNYFTNQKASYYLQPTMKDVLIQFSELAKLPKPGKGCLSPKQIAELRQWASVLGKKCPSRHGKKFFNQGQAWNTTLKRLRSLVSQGKYGRLQCASPRCQHQSKQGEGKFSQREKRSLPPRNICVVSAEL